MKQKLKLKKKNKNAGSHNYENKKQTRVCNFSVPRLTMTLYEFLILIQIKQPFSALLLKKPDKLSILSEVLLVNQVAET